MEEFLTLKDHVYNYLAEQISKGNIAIGEKINENSISDKLNISRTPVREALIQLSAEGFLDNTPRKGFVIKNVSPEEAKEIYFVIGILDGMAASLACPHITQKDMNDMEYYIESMSLAIQKANHTMYYKLQEEFHSVYLNVCPNRSLVHTLNLLKKKFLKKIYQPDDSQKTYEILEEANKEHEKMLVMFNNGESEKLSVYLRDTHWDTQKAYMESV